MPHHCSTCRGLRIEHAKELLKQSNLAVSEVADMVGYQDASYFTSLFKKVTAVTPIEYRSLVETSYFLRRRHRSELKE